MRLPFPVKLLPIAVLLCGFVTTTARADELYGRVRGVVTDQTGAVLPGVQFEITNVNTGISQQTASGSDGNYAFVNLVPGTYNLSASKASFKAFQVKAIAVTQGQIYVQNVSLEVGSIREIVEVTSNPAQVESTSMQLGGVISGQTIVDMPLNGRDWIQLQQLQPGVVSQSDRFGDAYATNGSQSQQNSFLINGVDSNDLPLNTPLVIPSPDAIAEFRLVTNTINPEYGRNSGAVLNAVIKSGTNSFHGSAFEFYRDTSLNATRFFFTKPEVFHRNQYGGTIGGPVWKNHTFFFFSYQGSRTGRAENVNDSGSAVNGLTQVFTNPERAGDFSEGAVGCPFGVNTSPVPLVDSNGVTQPAGTPYCTLWPNGTINPVNFNSISMNLMNTFVPPPNSGVRDFTFNPVHTETDDQYLARLDHTFSSRDSIWEYMLFETNPTQDALPFIGASLPGFGQTSKSHTKQFTAAWNHSFGVNTLNELRAGYSRLNFVAVEPAKSVQPSSLGFAINPQDPKDAGVPTISLAGLFTLGFTNDGPQPRKDDTYQITDNLSEQWGRHSLKFGFEGRRFGVSNPFFFLNNGSFTFNGTGPFSTTVPGADFLLGIPDSYAQSSGNIINARAYEYYSYAQDQFKVRNNLTLTFGAGWQVDTPLTDLTNHSRAINCFRPGQQSTLFPTAPAGLVFPGDANCTSSGYETRLGHVGPRVGFAWSPDFGHFFSGGPGKLAIRGGYGIYFNRSEEEVTLQNLIAPPFALIDFGIGDVGGVPSFAAPFTDVTQSNSIGNKYPFTPPPPGSNVDFSFFEPFSLNTLDPNFTIPYAMNYNLTVERELPARTILSIAYVGAMARHTLIAHELNPGINPQGCAADPTCVKFRNIQNLVFPNNFKYPGNVFGSIGEQSTIGNSNYNSLQVSLTKHLSNGLQFLASYTWSHSLDLGSSFENSSFGPRGTNPFNIKSDYGDSEFDARHRLVVSYSYELPGMRGGNAFLSRLLGGWKVAGITTFQTGFPVTINDSFGFHSLTCTAFSFYNCWDVPNVVGSIHTLDPRNATLTNSTQGSGTPQPNYFFDPNAFAVEADGTIGNARRNFFHGPGLNNSDFAIYKDTRLGSDTSKRIELRLEIFNVANHTQFQSTKSIPDGNINNGTFGRILSANPPRLIQLGVKFYF